MQGIGAEMSQDEAKTEMRRCSEEIFRCSENLVAMKEILAGAHTIWIAIGKNSCLLVAARILLVVALKHRANTAESPETLTKGRKEPLFWEETTKGGNLERETARKPTFLRILTKIEGRTQDSKLWLKDLTNIE